MPPKLLGQVERMLREHGVHRHGEDCVLVACSGGADSVSLAHVVSELLGARRVVLGHVNHGVRPDAESDATLVEQLSHRLNTGSLQQKVSPRSASEADLREARYVALAAMKDQAEASTILTAHTEDDQAETVLLGLLRSGTPESLLGIPKYRGGILRPLLGVSREEVRTYAKRHDLTFSEDSTNREPRYLRNRARKELLPLMERRYRPGISRRLARLADLLANLVEGSDTPKRCVGRDRTADEVKESAKGAEYRPMGIQIERREWSTEPIPDGKGKAVFDADQLGQPVVRLYERGDRIQPFGMKGRKKVSEVLRAAGVPKEARSMIPLVASENGRVIWVPGMVRSQDALVGSTTREVWVFSSKLDRNDEH